MTVESRSLAAAIWPTTGRETVVKSVMIAVLGSLLLWASAKVQIPFWPVPMTMQTYVVLLLGATCGWRLGTAAVLLYLAQGAIGLPVFANTPERGIGLAYMMGPTGGYLVGFVCATAMVGWLAERGWGRSLPKMIIAMAAGHAVILALGVVWLTYLFAFVFPTPEGATALSAAIAAGLTPFWAATVLKTALAAATVPLAWKVVKRSNR